MRKMKPFKSVYPPKSRLSVLADLDHSEERVYFPIVSVTNCKPSESGNSGERVLMAE